MLSDRSLRAASDAPDRTAPVLRERIYGAITCLSTLLILVRDGSSDFTRRRPPSTSPSAEEPCGGPASLSEPTTFWKFGTT